MNSIELFAGAGGLSLGLEKSGWESKMLIERNKHACNTLRLNSELSHPLAKQWNVVEGDVRLVDYSRIKSDIDLVAGGPPCQPFSLGGKHNAQHDDRDMFPEAIRAVKELGPKYFLFENVKGLLRTSFKEYFDYILARLEFPFESLIEGESWLEHYNRILKIKKSRVDFGSKYVYRITYKLLNAADYGIPQHRHRVIIVGIREDLDWAFKFPETTHCARKLLISKYVTFDYWKLHGLNIEDDTYVYKKLIQQIAKLKTSKISQSDQLEAYSTVFSAIKGLPNPSTGLNETNNNHILRLGAKPYPGHTGSPLHFPSKAIKAGDHGVPGGENMIAYSNGSYRYYTTREAACIQTFPNDYIFTGSWTESMRQIGNAVPVRLAEILGRTLLQQANNHKDEQRFKETRALQSA